MIKFIILGYFISTDQCFKSSGVDSVHLPYWFLFAVVCIVIYFAIECCTPYPKDEPRETSRQCIDADEHHIRDLCSQRLRQNQRGTERQVAQEQHTTVEIPTEIETMPVNLSQIDTAAQATWLSTFSPPVDDDKPPAYDECVEECPTYLEAKFIRS